jgi:hypothetical protein
MGQVGVVVAVVGQAVAAQLAAHRRGVPVDPTGDLAHAQLLAAQRRDPLTLQR